MPSSDELLVKVNDLKNTVAKHDAQTQKAQTQLALLEAQQEKLTESLDGIEWSELDDAIVAAAERAQQAVQALQAALVEAGIE